MTRPERKRYDLIAADYARGMAMSTLCEKYGITDGTVHNAIKATGTPKRGSLVRAAPKKSRRVADMTPSQVERQRAYQRAWQNAYRNTPEGKLRTRASNLKKYGVTPEQYDQMLADQGGVCAACRRPEKGQNQRGPISMAVDHCHSTGRVRGLLCMACNRTLGLLGDSADRLRQLATYRERFGQ